MGWRVLLILCEGRDALERIYKRDKVAPEGTWGWAYQFALAASLLVASGMSPAQSLTDSLVLQAL